MTGNIDKFVRNSLAAVKDRDNPIFHNEENQLIHNTRVESKSSKKYIAGLEERIEKLERYFEILFLATSSSNNISLEISNIGNSQDKFNADINNNTSVRNVITNEFNAEFSVALEILMDAKNQAALEMFESLKAEVQSANPKAGTIEGLWSVITKAVPAVKDALEIGKVIAVLA
jgi:plasmid maintenance system killer protein